MQCMASSTLSALGFTLAQRLIAELWSNLHQVPTRTHERAGSRKDTHARARAHTHTLQPKHALVSLAHTLTCRFCPCRPRCRAPPTST
jgi:hypothetical protein